MQHEIFISHAGADSKQAAAVADALTGSGIGVGFDRNVLNLGESFLSFMESALADSNYCLLLWSQRAADTPWIQMEWESALYRSVEEKRAF
jgi:TIR domain